MQYANIAPPTLVKENFVGPAPFTIAICTATLGSLMGRLLPSRKAVRTAVPSGSLRFRMGDVMKMQNREAYLKIPIKLGMKGRDLFGQYLGSLVDECSRLRLQVDEHNPTAYKRDLGRSNL